MTSSRTKLDDQQVGVNETNDPIQQLLDDRQRWPKWLRPLHVALTGVPDPGAKPRDTTPIKMLVEDVSVLTVSAALSAWAADAVASSNTAVFAGPIAIVGLVAALGAIGRLRRLVVGHSHEAGHGVVSAFYRENGIDDDKAMRRQTFIQDAATLITLTQNGQDYAREHEDHHGQWLGTANDPDGAMLKEWGFWPGMDNTVREQMWLTILNPIWHLRFLAKRLQSNLLHGPVYRRVLAAIRVAMGIGGLALLPLPSALALIAIWVPGYQIASLLQVLTIHTYGHTKPADTPEDYAERTHERIPYRLMPRSSNPLEWFRWSWSMLGHVAARLTVLDSTMIAHGWHHLAWPTGNPFNDWWNTSLRMVNAYVEGKLPEGWEQRILWGLVPGLERQQANFDRLADRS